MSTFTELRDSLQSSFDAVRETEEKIYAWQQQSMILDGRITSEKNRISGDLPPSHSLLASKLRLESDIRRAEEEKEKELSTYTNNRNQLLGMGPESSLLSELDDDIPFLLLPVKVQTRYCVTKYITRNIKQELVTDISTLPSVLSENIRRVMPEHFKGRPAKNLYLESSFQFPALTSSAGTHSVFSTIHRLSGRRPANRIKKKNDEYKLMIRFFPDDIFLEMHEESLTEQETAAGKIFWKEVWDSVLRYRQSEQQPGFDRAGSQKLKTDQQVAAWRLLHSSYKAHRAAWISRVMRPLNYRDGLFDIQSVPQFPAVPQKPDDWTRPPVAEILPDRFIVRVYYTDTGSSEYTGNTIPPVIHLGFDPQEKNDERYFAAGPAKNTLSLPPAIAWLTDYEEAVKAGMAITINLNKEQFDKGIKKIVVLGVSLQTNPEWAGKKITRLFQNHHYKPGGFSFLPAGTATNNIRGDDSPGLKPDPVLQSFKTEMGSPLFNESGTSHMAGKRLADALGIESSVFQHIEHADNPETQHSLRLNTLLWDGTLGYYLDQWMRPQLLNEDLDYVRTFFCRYVSGRGMLPVIRTGKQPYGFVPATVWSRWKPDEAELPAAARLLNILSKLDRQWKKFLDGNGVITLEKLGQSGNTGKEQWNHDFLKLISHQPVSVGFSVRKAIGEYLIWNMAEKSAELINPMFLMNKEMIRNQNRQIFLNHLKKYGIFLHPGEFRQIIEKPENWGPFEGILPRAATRFFNEKSTALFESVPLREGNLQDQENFLTHLWNATYSQLQTNNFIPDPSVLKTKSEKLLAELARFSLLQTWIRAVLKLSDNKFPGSISPLAHLDLEMEYLSPLPQPGIEHKDLLGIDSTGMVVQKPKWLYGEQTPEGGLSIIQNIEQLLNTNSADPSVSDLKKSRDAIRDLKSLRSSDLDLLVREHIDQCSYRLDAWLQGLVMQRLDTMRKDQPTGLHLAGYGYVENLNPSSNPWIEYKEIHDPEVISNAQANPGDIVLPVFDFSMFSAGEKAVALKNAVLYLGNDQDTRFIFKGKSGKPQTVNKGNKEGRGFMLTPSLAHAATAAVLRSGYESQQSSDNPSAALAVNINSKRAGKAEEVLKGLQSGYSITEQLGFFIEQKLYEKADLAQLTEKCRKAFPLDSEIQEWNSQSEEIPPRIKNYSLVTDGLALINSKQKNSLQWRTLLQAISAISAIVLKGFLDIVREAEDIFDSVSDLLLAEGVFQTVNGSPEKASVALRMAGEGEEPALPEINHFSVPGKMITHRTGIVLNIPGGPVVWPGPASPASALSPDINKWLEEQLPPPKSVFVTVSSGTIREKVSIDTTGLQPIDFFMMLSSGKISAEDHYLRFLFVEGFRKKHHINFEIPINVNIRRDDSFRPGEFALMEIVSILQCIGRMLGKARVMKPEDWFPETGSRSEFQAVNLSAVKLLLTKFIVSREPESISALLERLEQKIRHLSAANAAITRVEVEDLILYIRKGAQFGIYPVFPSAENEAEFYTSVIQQAGEMAVTLNEKRNAVQKLLTNMQSASAGEAWDACVKICAHLFGDHFRILPRFELPNSRECLASVNDRNFQSQVTLSGIDDWLKGLALIKEGIREYLLLTGLRECVPAKSGSRLPKIIQIPVTDGKTGIWAANKIPDGAAINPGTTCLAYEFSIPPAARQNIAGWILETWNESIPDPVVHAGAAIHFNQPDHEAPQVVLVAVSPERTGHWNWENLMNTILETIDLAKKRAVDPVQLQTSFLGQFLPALVTPAEPTENMNTATVEFNRINL